MQMKRSGEPTLALDLVKDLGDLVTVRDQEQHQVGNADQCDSGTHRRHSHARFPPRQPATNPNHVDQDSRPTKSGGKNASLLREQEKTTPKTAFAAPISKAGLPPARLAPQSAVTDTEAFR